MGCESGWGRNRGYGKIGEEMRKESIWRYRRGGIDVEVVECEGYGGNRGWG